MIRRAGTAVGVIACLCAGAAQAEAARVPNPLHVRVSPLVGTPRTVFRIGLDSPARLRSAPPASDRNVATFTLGVEARAVRSAAACEPGLYADSGRARRGQRLRLRLAPSTPTRPLCPGLWRGTIATSQGIACFVDPCPLSPAFTQRVARFAFVVVSAP